MSLVILQGYILVSEGDLEIVEKELPNHVRTTLQEKGCLKFVVEKDSDVTNRFNVYEEFVDEEAFEFHQKRVSESTWGRITCNVKRYYEVKRI